MISAELAAFLQSPPPVRGTMVPNAPLADTSWFRVGGPADLLFKPADADDLALFLKALPETVPVTVLGVASNTLIRDGGVRGVVIRLGPAFGSIRVEGTTLNAGAAALDLNIARAAQAAGLGGLEFLSGIPGTLGGGLRMNAGAYGREFKDIVLYVATLDRQGNFLRLSVPGMGFGYRRCAAPDSLIFLGATLQGAPDNPARIQERMATIREARSGSQPIHEKTGGSTFANPDNDPQNRKAWQLIEAAGCRGLRRGGAMVSEKHCNFLMNTGTATATDLEELGEEVRRRVGAISGLDLRWEIRRIGERESPSSGS